MVSGRETVDVIVVGAGSAGAVIARRITDRTDARVLLLEAGGTDANPAIHDPLRMHELWDAPEDWGYRTVPQEHAAGRRLHWPRGRVLGGSSALNGMIHIRGWRGDFDGWGAPGWTYDDVLPLFRRMEDVDRGPSRYRGAGGPLHVSSTHRPDAIQESIVAAAQEVGMPFNDDHNGPELEGVGFTQLTVKDGRRQSTAQAYLRPVMERPALTVLTGARARRLLLEGTRCTGVEWTRDGATERARAGEIVVCAGAIDSPKLLLLSGIGDARELRRLGIAPTIDVPGVGANLYDHLLCPVLFTTRRQVPPTPPGLPTGQSHLFWRSRPDLSGPDLQPLAFSLPLYEPWMDSAAPGFSLMAGLIRPESRGALRLASADPDKDPLIDPATLRHPADLEALAAAVRLCREIGRAPALAEWGPIEAYPAAHELRDYIRRTVITYHHQAGTCRMGVDDRAVVDPELRVHGVAGLRVADASIMPAVTSGNTNAPTVMIGERAADLVCASPS